MSFHDASSTIHGDGRPVSIDPGTGMVRFGNDANINVLFYNKAVHDKAASEQHGRVIYKNKVYVRIQHPGEKDYTDDPLDNKPHLTQRFPRQWAQFQQSQQQIPEGTPVDCLFVQNPEISANLHTLGVHTIEQLATLTEAGAASIGMGATQWRNKARQYLEVANKGVAAHKFEAAIAERDNKIEVLSNQLAAVKAQLDRLLAERQGVPEAMVPQHRPTVAQAQAQALSDWTLPKSEASGMEAPALSDWSAPSIVETTAAPRKRGRPAKTTSH